MNKQTSILFYIVILVAVIYFSSVNFVLAADTTPPVFVDIHTSGITSTSATVWETTNELADTLVEYGPTISYGSSLPPTFAGGYVIGTNFGLSNLTPSIVYHFRVKAKDSAGNLTVSNDYTFTTLAATTTTASSDTTVPSVPTGLVATAISSSQINLSWTASSDNVGVTGYNIFRNGTYIISVTAAVSSVSYSNTGLSAGTSYSYTVAAYDLAGNVSSQSSSASATTQSVSSSDTSAPSVPTSLTATASSPSQINLSWNASNDNVGVSGYKIYRGGSLWYQVTGTSYSDTGLTSNTSYSYYVKAFDAAGNESAPSTTVSATTQSGVVSCTGLTLTFQNNKTTYVQGETVTYTYTCSPGGTTSYVEVQVVKPDGTATTYNTSSGSISTNAFGFGTSNLSAGTYTLRACFTAGCSIVTASAQFYITISSSIPPVPSGLTAGFASYSTPTVQVASLKWGGITSNITQFRIYSRQQGSAWPTYYDQRDPGSIISSSGGMIEVHIGLPGNSSGTYEFKVQACNSAGCSSDSNTAQLVLSSTTATTTATTTTATTTTTTTTDTSTSTTITTTTVTSPPPPSPPPPPPPPPPLPPPAPVSQSNATILGNVKDAKEQAVSGASVHIYTADYSRNYGLTTDSSGTFKVVIPSGEYFAEIFPPSLRPDLLKPEPVKFSVSGEETKTLVLKFLAHSKVVTGTVIFFDGKPVTDAEVGAYSSKTGQWASVPTDLSGNYVINVSGGFWDVSIRPKDSLNAKWSWFGAPQAVYFENDSVSEKKTVNFTVAAANSTLVVTTIDDEGKVIPGAGIVVDSISSSATIYDSRTPSEFQKSDSQGKAIFILPAKTYYVRGFLAPEFGYFNPSEQEVLLPSNDTKNIKLIFTRQKIVTSVEFKGRARLDTGEAADSFIWGWSEQGGYTETRSLSDGLFTLNLATGGKWHIGAGKELNGIPYRSSEIIIESAAVSLSIDLVLNKIQALPLPPVVTVTQSAAQPVVLQAEDGAKMIIPASSAASSGQVNVEIKATVEAPMQAAAQVVSTVYDVSVKDSAGKEITFFSNEIEITIPYDEEVLAKEGVLEKNIVPSSFDDGTKNWVALDNYTIDKEKNIAVARVKHLTRFAIVAAADITPPAAPALVAALALGSGQIKITWTNPIKDFDHAKVYRSELAGTLGNVVAAEVKAASFVDNSEIAGGKIYYYAVRSVDPAGNESTNTNQVSVTAIGSSAKILTQKTPAALPPEQTTKLEILRNLAQGDSGEEVKALQQLLLDEGVYPEGLITGFFGELTKKAVIRFQEKYSSEIIMPAGLVSGTGFVGPGTRKKITELLGGGLSAPTIAKTPLPPGQAVKAVILRNLAQGMEGEDVKSLQQLLLAEGVYPEGLVTGFFGSLTKQAVIRFQEKYASEILAPVGLSSGSGFVGSGTRKKIGELLK